MSIQFDPMWLLLIFNLVGGLVIGSVLRGFIRGKLACNSIFLFVWGAVFGGIPLLAGIAEFERNPFLPAAQIFVFAVTIIVVALAPDILVESFATPPLRDTIIGGLCAAIGIALLIATLADPTDWLFKVMMGGAFAVVGSYIIIDGAKKLIRHD